jgi:uncharacterized glyoxalase superfamily protein PhnB
MPERDSIEPHFWAADLALSRRFYEEALGFDVLQSFPPDAPTWHQLGRGSTRIMLATLPAQTQGPQAHLAAIAGRRGGGAVSLYLHVPDAEAEHARCVAAKADVIEPVWDPWWGGRQFTVTDPDGNWWTVYQAELDPA